MQLNFTVASAHRGPCRILAPVGDQVVETFTADGLVVELTCGAMTHTLQIANGYMDVLELFAPGAQVLVTYDAPPAPEA